MTWSSVIIIIFKNICYSFIFLSTLFPVESQSLLKRVRLEAGCTIFCVSTCLERPCCKVFSSFCSFNCLSDHSPRTLGQVYNKKLAWGTCAVRLSINYQPAACSVFIGWFTEAAADRSVSSWTLTCVSGQVRAAQSAAGGSGGGGVVYKAGFSVECWGIQTG